MDKKRIGVKNPFKPTFGIVPEVVAGRDSVVAQVVLALEEGAGSPYRFTMISGARGSGKTVLLNLLEKNAKEMGWVPLRVTASGDMISKLLHSDLPRILHEQGFSQDKKQVTGASVAGIGSISIAHQPRFQYQETLHSMLRRVVEELDDKGSGLLLSLDELQSASPADIHILTDAIQDVVRDELSIALSVAGLPYEIAQLLDHPGTTFLRRSVPIQLEALSDTEVRTAFSETARHGSKQFSSDALDMAVDVAHGYPYLVQLLGSIAWAISRESEISVKNFEKVIPLMKERMALQVHAPAMRGVPEREREYLHIMSESGVPMDTAAIAAKMGIPTNQQSTYRARLIERGLIMPAGYGKVTFALPYLGDYLHAEGREY